MKQDLKKVMIVDDDREILEMLYEAFRSWDIELTTVNNIFDAIYMIKNHRFDLIITDYNMPNPAGLDGVDIIRYAKMLGKKTSVILLSCSISLEIEQVAYECGASNVILKPCDIKLLEEKFNENGIFESDEQQQRPDGDLKKNRENNDFKAPI
jgi:DNA-binding NtrC family response regulator